MILACMPNHAVFVMIIRAGRAAQVHILDVPAPRVEVPIMARRGEGMKNMVVRTMRRPKRQ